MSDSTNNLQDSISIIYQDDRLIAINKPNNVLVHHSHYSRNIREDSLLQILKKQTGEAYYPVHRLDRKTSGIMILCKNTKDIPEFQKLIEQNLMKKVYWAIARGYADDQGIINTPVKHPETDVYKEAESHYKTLDKVELDIPVGKYLSSRYSWLELTPKTGRIHQLRIHLNKISHPIVGDHKYGDRFHNKKFVENWNLDQLFLHARSLSFTHPFSGQQLLIEAPVPKCWEQAFEKMGWKLSL